MPQYLNSMVCSAQTDEPHDLTPHRRLSRGVLAEVWEWSADVGHAL